MKPRTKIHHEVIALRNKLPKITKEHKIWAYQKLFKFWAYKTKHKAVCFECGYAWQMETNLISKLFPFACPKCKKELEMADGKSWRHEEIDHFQILTTCGGFQVIRMFCISHYCKKGYKASYSCLEIYQHWISPKGKLVILALNSNPMGGWRSGHTCWCWGSPMEIRGEHDRFFINNVSVYPKKIILSNIKRNGFRGNFYKFNPAYFFSLILTFPVCETLLKSGQIEMLKSFDLQKEYIKTFWQSIKICIRNNYIITKPDIWFDHLRNLVHFRKDIHNAKYICPADLIREHQILNDRKQAIKDREEFAELEQEIEKANILYQKTKSKFFGINLTNGEISVIVLDNVKEFYLEGKAMHHCVFTNGYYKYNDTLIMSARKGKERLETLQVSLQKFSIMQSRGACNQDSKYHKDIVKLVSENMEVIKKASRK
jgi:hypothetical protein